MKSSTALLLLSISVACAFGPPKTRPPVVTTDDADDADADASAPELISPTSIPIPFALHIVGRNDTRVPPARTPARLPAPARPYNDSVEKTLERLINDTLSDADIKHRMALVQEAAALMRLAMAPPP